MMLRVRILGDGAPPLPCDTGIPNAPTRLA